MSLALQRFEGASVEAALSAAVRALGAGMKVREAKRIRRGGIAGFFAREHYEVLAEPGTVPSETIDLTAPLPAGVPFAPDAVQERVDATLRALVEEVEARETPAPNSGRHPAPPTAPAVFALPPLRSGTEPVAEPAVTRPPATPPRFSEEDLVPLVEEVAVEDTPAEEEPDTTPLASEFYDFEELEAQPCTPPPRWSRKALRDLGLPAALLRELPERTPTHDQAWLKALEKAIARTVPAPLSERADAPARVVGEGLDGAVLLIRAGAAGFPPGEIVLDGEAHPATPTVLARAVRSCLPR